MARQTSIVWVILVAIGCFDLGSQQLLLTAKERKRHARSSVHQIKVKQIKLKNSVWKKSNDHDLSHRS